MRNFIMIAPHGAPGTNGVGDQVSLIENALVQSSDIPVTRVGVVTRAQEADSSKNLVLREDPHGLIRILDRVVEPGCTLVVHYVCYGFQRRGCPLLFIKYLRKLRSQRSFRLITVFHELEATGPIWSSTFYVSPIQKLLIRALAKSSDWVATSTSSYRKYLKTLKSRVDTHPVISNIGEPKSPLDLKDRQNTAVIFGLPHSRRRLLESSILAPLLTNLSVQRVVEIGQPLNFTPPQIPGVAWFQKGELSAEEVSRELTRCRFGLLLYDPGRLEKSGMFAAFSAHRLVPVLISDRPTSPGELIPNSHYLNGSDSTSIMKYDFQEVADRSWNWYSKERSLAACLDLYQRWIQE